MNVGRSRVVRTVLMSAVVAVVAGVAAPAMGADESRVVHAGPAGTLTYVLDEHGNTIPDFSNCGYMGGGVAIPDVPVKVTVAPAVAGGRADDTARLQKAIDELSAMPVGADGFRGALLIKKGTYRIGGQLKVSASGVVLRGEGDGKEGTVLVAAGKTRRELIRVGGKKGLVEQKGSVEITDEYVPVGARTFTVKDASGLKVGDTVIVRRVGNAAWIHFIKMDQIQGRPGNEQSTKQWQAFDLPFDRVVTKVEGNRVTVDAPVACAIEQRWGGGTVARYDDSGRIANVGIENIRAVSEYDPAVRAKDHGEEYASDEDHATYFVGFGDVKNAWQRDCTSVHFYHGPASIGRGAKWVTVQDCKALEPVSVITGGRRYPFAVEGQLNLVQRCYAKDARHAFVVGARVCGPNVFLDSLSERDHATSEPHHRWSVGGLYDNVHAQMAFQDRQWMGSGHGWAGANYVAWNCEGSLVCQRPPTAQNYAIGFVGKREKGAFDRPAGLWESYGKHVEPRSLYLRQLEDRLGKDAVANVSGRHQASAAASATARFAGAEAMRSENGRIAVSLDQDGRTLTIEQVGGGKMRATAEAWGGLGAQPAAKVIDWQGGKGIELTSPDGNRQVIWAEQGTPFVCTKVWARNAGGEEKVVHDWITLKTTAQIGTPIGESRWFGSDGLADGRKGKSSYAFLAAVDPKSNAGVVGGWVTHERASGIVVGTADDDSPTVAAKAEYGRLVIPAGQTAEGETFAIGFFADAHDGLEQLADLTARANHIKLPDPMCGYSTWYHAHALDQERMAQLAKFCKEQRLTDFGMNFLQIDDQWQIARRDFTSHKPNGPYPDGMKLTADHIKAAGMTAGLWLTPFGWDSKLPLFADHQDWFVHRRSDGKVYDVKWAGDCLDMSHPEARAFLKGVIGRMTHEWGYGLLKIDGLWAGMACSILYPQPTYRDDGLGDAVFHDKLKTNEEVYRDGLRLIRESAAPGTFILGCNIAQNMRTMGGSMGLVDSMRVGPDIKANWEAVIRCAKPAGWLYFLNGRVWWNDPDCLMLREPLTLDMGRAWGSFIALSGQLHLVSEWLPGLPPERLDVLKRTVPNRAHAARPVDLFEHEMPRVWHMTWGDGDQRHDVVGLFNWNAPASAETKSTAGTGQEEPTTEAASKKSGGDHSPIKLRVDLKELGLPAGRYVGFDYWGNQFVPAFEGSTEFEVAPGSCKVIAFRRQLDRPTVVSTSRHVTQGSVELADVKWDASSGTLSGRSKLVGQDPYELRLDTAGRTAAEVSVADSDKAAGVTTSVHQVGAAQARVAIQSSSTREVAWEIRFRGEQ